MDHQLIHFHGKAIRIPPTRRSFKILEPFQNCLFCPGAWFHGMMVFLGEKLLIDVVLTKLMAMSNECR
jgi:hypothetical protein